MTGRLLVCSPVLPEFDRGEGVYFYDRKGRRYLDFLSQLFNCNLGHGNRAVIDAIRRQAERAEDVGSKAGDLDNLPGLDPQDVEHQRAVLGLTGRPKIAGHGRLAIGCRRNHPHTSGGERAQAQA